MRLVEAFRLPISPKNRLAFVGAGGKTTGMFRLAYELEPALVTTSTHLGAWQASYADRHIIWKEDDPLPDIESTLCSGVTLITGALEGDTGRLLGLSLNQLAKLDALAGYHDLPILVEADGARLRPLKAPAAHEPVIPPYTDLAIVFAGLSALGKPLTSDWVHRPDRFTALTGLGQGQPISLGSLASMLTHSEGGKKGIPARASRVVFLNQADTADLQSAGQELARMLLPEYRSVVIASFESSKERTVTDEQVLRQSAVIHAVYEPVAAIILAAGGARRFGQPKQLLPWEGEPFVRRVARTALEAGLSPVIVVTGAWVDEVDGAVRGLRVRIANNPDWQAGQGGSVRVGAQALPEACGGAVFLLADQPQIPVTLISALLAEHAHTLAPIVAPMVNGQRGNPVLFDRATFPDLLTLSGDSGGRALFSRYKVTWLPWHDASILTDVDTLDDYHKLVGK
jgi:molybdenum cofactor cytidylyltransferase